MAHEIAQVMLDLASPQDRHSARLSVQGLDLKDKISDGKDERRDLGTLKATTGYAGSVPYSGGEGQVMRSKINRYKDCCRSGKSLCYDKMESMGQAYYLYSLPVNIMRGLLQGLKTESAVKQFNKECKILQTHKGTNYMFMHWDNKGTETSHGDWSTHPYVVSRPDLATSIESLGNFISANLLYPETAFKKQPGGLCNNKNHTNGAQPPHFDVTGWQGVPANQLPHILHMPLCEEGMMLHIFPTERNEATHHLGRGEKMKVGTPVFVHIAFGDALLLRADVAHGGCYGCTGNFRFHMMFRRPDCTLETTRLHYLSGVSEKKSYKEAMHQFGTMDSETAFQKARKHRTTSGGVRSYIQAIKNLYPEENTWHATLFEAVHHRY
jgi:hypothetical protein